VTYASPDHHASFCVARGLVRLKGLPSLCVRRYLLGSSLVFCCQLATMQCPTLDAARAACELPLEHLHTIARDMVHEMRQGLASDGCQLMMLPSHVTSLPDG